MSWPCLESERASERETDREQDGLQRWRRAVRGVETSSCNFEKTHTDIFSLHHHYDRWSEKQVVSVIEDNI